MRMRLLFCALCLLCAAGAGAGTIESTASERESVSLTVYGENLGLVREIRSLSLPGGEAYVRFQDVASSIDATSVDVRVLRGLEGFELLEQNYEFDLMSPEKLMEKYVGRRVELLVSHPESGEETAVPADLLSVNGGPIYRIGDRIHIGHPGRVVLPGIPENLIARPTLVWKVKGKGGKGLVETSYLAAGLGWKADYVAVLDRDDVSMDLTAWVTLTNTSGAGYEDARVKLVAGDVRRVGKRAVDRMGTRELLYAAEMMVEEEPFFEYHLYTLPARTTMKDNQTKQVELLGARGVSVGKEYVLPARGGRLRAPGRLGEVGKEHVLVTVRFRNDEPSGLGVPLPAGVFRFYKRDSEDALHFVGEDRIDHVPRGEELVLEVGTAFDILAQRIETDYQVIKREQLYERAYRITLTNAKSEEVTVKVMEEMAWDWEILSSSHSWTKEAAGRISFSVPVPPEGKTELEYRVRVKAP